MKAHLAKLGMETRLEGQNCVLETRLAGTLKLLTDFDQLPWKSEHRTRVGSWLEGSGDGDKFSGGKAQKLRDDLTGDIDLKPFQAAYDQFKRGGLKAKLDAIMLDCVPRRKRRFSEDDGEWQFDRRHEDQPFQQAYRKLTPNRVIELEVNFTVSAYAKAEEINRYGALVWGVSQLLESCGVQTRIVWLNHAQKSCADYRHSSVVRVELKKPSEYLSPSLLAAVFQTVFYRRLGFSMITAALEAQGKTASSGLGSPVSSYGAEFSKGKLRINPDAMQGHTASLEKALIQALTGK